MKYTVVVTVIGEIFSTVMMHSIIMVFSKKIETTKYFSYFPIIFHKFPQKLIRKCHKISIKIVLKNLYEVFPTFLQNFFTISLKFQRNIFDVF